jgi:hypothetical protein
MDLFKLTGRRVKKLSDIASDVGLVSLASVVLPAVLDKFNPLMILLGGVIAIGFWTLSILLTK